MRTRSDFFLLLKAGKQFKAVFWSYGNRSKKMTSRRIILSSCLTDHSRRSKSYCDKSFLPFFTFFFQIKWSILYITADAERRLFWKVIILFIILFALRDPIRLINECYRFWFFENVNVLLKMCLKDISYFHSMVNEQLKSRCSIPFFLRKISKCGFHFVFTLDTPSFSTFNSQYLFKGLFLSYFVAIFTYQF